MILAKHVGEPPQAARAERLGRLRLAEHREVGGEVDCCHERVVMVAAKLDIRVLGGRSFGQIERLADPVVDPLDIGQVDCRGHRVRR